MYIVRNRIRLIIGGFALLTVIGVTSAATLISGPPPPPPYTPTPPDVALPVDRAPLTLEEDIRIREQVEREQAGWYTWVTGKETKGTTIRINQRDIKLPADAYVKERVLTGLCDVALGGCPEFPLLVIARGSSTFLVSAPSGIIYEEKVAPGEEGTFDFLKEALR